MSSDNDWKNKMKEIDLAMSEFEKMMMAWDKRDADPLVVASIGIVKFVALVGPIFEREADYLLFIHKCVTQGILMYREEEDDDGSPEYLH